MLYDVDIREPLFDYLECEFGIVRCLEEVTIGKARCDALMVTSHSLYGIEIKSDADSYVRLKNQVKEYDKFFDYNIVCVGTSHIQHISEHIPEYWGIISVDEENGIDFYYYRKAKPNPKMKLKKKLSLLWRPELVKIQQYFKLPAYKQKSKEFVVDKIIEKCDVVYLNEQICNCLFERDYTLIEEEILRYKKGS